MYPRTQSTSVLRVSAGLLCFGVSIFASRAMAHGISEASQSTIAEGGVVDYIWLGAEHMVTGYDHLLFLFGVLFFLSNFKDVVRFITAFTLGHCITLLGATLAGISANAYIIDAVIALSVIYKGFENLDGFRKTLKIEAPNLLFMVFIFGLIHGFGLSTRLQELTLGQEGLVSRILAFNVGVELGQIAALTVMLGIFAAWKKSASFERFSIAANGALVLAGLGLFVMQIDDYLHDDAHHTHEVETEGNEHSHEAEAATHATEVHQHEVTAGEVEHAHGGTTPDETEDASTNQKEEIKEEQSHGHGHGHGHGHSHSHGEPEKEEEPVETTGHGHSHSHGSGASHSH